MKYAVEIRLTYHGIYIKFHKDWFRHSKVNAGGESRARRQHDDLPSLLFQNKERRLKCKGGKRKEMGRYLKTFYIWEESETVFPVLKVLRQCPFVLLV
jgi:hypothetical protein